MDQFKIQIIGNTRMVCSKISCGLKRRARSSIKSVSISHAVAFVFCFDLDHTPVIHSDYQDIPYNETRDGLPNIYLPEYHKFPLVMTVYPPANWDWLSQVYPLGLVNAYNKKKATISQPLMIAPSDNNTQAVAEANTWCTYYLDYIPKTENCMEPLSQWYDTFRLFFEISMAFLIACGWLSHTLPLFIFC
jgi:hypothetical protein